MKLRSTYFSIIIIIIILGLFSRKLEPVPLIVGDILYAMMMYFIVRFINTNINKLCIAIISITLCYCIEFIQLLQSEWIVNLRATTLGHLVLGHGFLWSDLIAYTFGILICYFVDKNQKKILSKN